MINQIKLESTVYTYSSEKELPDPKDSLLLTKAREVSLKAYAPYSKFNVGAAARLESGEIVLGNNQENVAYPSGICAERVAVFYAGAMFPGDHVETIAIVAHSDNFKMDTPVAPCGACRQVLAEYEERKGSGIRILLSSDSGEIYEIRSVGAILPLAFLEEGLKE